MTFESEVFNIAAIYIWLPPESYVVFRTTLVSIKIKAIDHGVIWKGFIS